MNTNQEYKIGNRVMYRNGNPSLYTGIIVKVKENELVVIDEDDNAAMELWKAGCAVGTCIQPSQVKVQF